MKRSVVEGSLEGRLESVGQPSKTARPGSMHRRTGV